MFALPSRHDLLDLRAGQKDLRRILWVDYPSDEVAFIGLAHNDWPEVVRLSQLMADLNEGLNRAGFAGGSNS